MNVTPYIKECPFCGGRSEFIYFRGKYHIECTVCKARTRIANTLGEVTYLWNRRDQE